MLGHFCGVTLKVQSLVEWRSVEGTVAFGSTHMRKSKRLFPRWFLKVETMHVTSCHSYRLIDMLYVYEIISTVLSIQQNILIYVIYTVITVHITLPPIHLRTATMMFHHPNQKKTLSGEGAAFCNLLSNPDVTNPFGLFVKSSHHPFQKK